MATKPKANLYASTELKNTTDDAIAPYMQSLGFQQSHFLTDVRLTLGFTACLIAGVTFYYDFQLGFEKTKHYTLYAVVAYFIINSILTLWIWGVEGSCVYVGSKDGVKIALSTCTEKYKPEYTLEVKTTKGNSVEVAKVKNSFTGWFDQQGFFVPKPFHAFLENSIPELARHTLEASKAEEKR